MLVYTITGEKSEFILLIKLCIRMVAMSENEISDEVQEYLDSSVFLLKQLKQMIRGHNKMLAVTAASGDVPSSSMLLHNNVACSSIDLLLNFPLVKHANEIDAERFDKETPMDLN